MSPRALQLSPQDVSHGVTPAVGPTLWNLTKMHNSRNNRTRGKSCPRASFEHHHHPSASMHQHAHMTNMAPIYVLLFGKKQSQLPPPGHTAIMELPYIFAGAGTLSPRDKRPTWFSYDTHSTKLPLFLDIFASTTLIDTSRPGRMIYWCPLAQTRDTLEPGAALDDAAALCP